MSQRIMESWLALKEHAMPADAPPIQVKEMCRAFFAGAASFLAIASLVSQPEISEEDGVKIFQEADKEITEFFAKLSNDINGN